MTTPVLRRNIVLVIVVSVVEERDEVVSLDQA
jgi:hypothetical protein